MKNTTSNRPQSNRLMTSNDPGENYRNVIQRIHTAELDSGRPPGSVQLVAVGKLHPADAIRELAIVGQRSFAENFVQEALAKQQQLSDLDLEWHFIGSIQSNKTRDIANHFSWVHSVDRYKIARRLNDQRAEHLPSLKICIQVNLQGERSKSGVFGDQVLPLLKQMSDMPRISVRGFMSIPELDTESANQRAIFARLRQLLEETNCHGYSLDVLSMGMTADLESAISEGATHVRIGTALFGPRPAKTINSKLIP